jgi:hypothetical protein
MKRPMPYLHTLTIILFLCTSLLWGREKCDCPAAPLKGDTLIFKGRVLDISSNHVASGLKITMGVSRIYQGDTDPVTVVSTPWPGSACGFPFEKDSMYLVYAYRGRSIRTDACQKTRLLTNGEDAEEELGQGFEARRNLDQIYKGIQGMILATLGGFLLLFGILFFRKWYKGKKPQA